MPTLGASLRAAPVDLGASVVVALVEELEAVGFENLGVAVNVGFVPDVDEDSVGCDDDEDTLVCETEAFPDELAVVRMGPVATKGTVVSMAEAVSVKTKFCEIRHCPSPPALNEQDSKMTSVKLDCGIANV
jgi:hypothetical protein